MIIDTLRKYWQPIFEPVQWTLMRLSTACRHSSLNCHNHTSLNLLLGLYVLLCSRRSPWLLDLIGFQLLHGWLTHVLRTLCAT